MTMLENLWYGNISPFEQFLNGNERFQSLLLLMAKDREKLSEHFTPEQTEWIRACGHNSGQQSCQISPNFRLYSIGLKPPSDSLMRFSRYHIK